MSGEYILCNLVTYCAIVCRVIFSGFLRFFLWLFQKVSFTKNEYEVTFNAVGGTPEPPTQMVKYKGKASAPSPVPTKNGYTFKGWYNKAGNTLWDFAVNEVTQNTELYAKWRINTYTVTFSVKGTPANGTLKAEFDDTESSSGDPVDYNKTVIFTAKPATGYKVDTWTITGSSFEASTGTDGNPIAKVKITADTNVKVSFTKNEYTVTFDADGGTPAPAAQTVKYKEKASVPSEPVKEGYTFKGWHNKAGNAPWNFTVNEVTGNTELYAKWQINTYPVTFNVEGAPPNGTLKAELAGSVIVSGNPVEHGKSVTFTAAPASDYKVDTWTVTPASAVQEGGTPGSLIAKVKVSSATTVKVTFKLADKTYTVNGIDFIMKSIAAVTNGSVGHVDADDNKPHTVSLSAYRIGETEVTQELWQAVMGNNPSDLYGYGSVPAKGEVQGKRPVDTVSWFECIAFCNELTKKVNGGSDAQCVYTFGGHIYSTADATAKKVPVMDMSKKGFRLPTEAEWEWAAKGGTEDKWAGTNEEAQLVNYAWYDDFYGGDAHLRTHEVKKKLPNAYGLYDMSGNVSEWCWDWYDSFPYSLPADYTGPTSGLRRTLRGGDWGGDRTAPVVRDGTVFT